MCKKATLQKVIDKTRLTPYEQQLVEDAMRGDEPKVPTTTGLSVTTLCSLRNLERRMDRFMLLNSVLIFILTIVCVVALTHTVTFSKAQSAGNGAASSNVNNINVGRGNQKTGHEVKTTVDTDLDMR
jgi:hypothetical protein